MSKYEENERRKPPCPSALVEAAPPVLPPSPHQDQGAWGAAQAEGKFAFFSSLLFLFWMVVSHLDASPPRPWREEVPEAKTGNLLVYHQLQQGLL